MITDLRTYVFTAAVPPGVEYKGVTFRVISIKKAVLYGTAFSYAKKEQSTISYVSISLNGIAKESWNKR